MGFKTDGLAATYLSVQATAGRARSFSVSSSAALVAGNVSANAVIQIMSNMKSFIEELSTASSTPGMAQYAKDQSDDQGYDVVAEFLACERSI